MEDFDGLTFFAHARGLTRTEYTEEKNLEIIASTYYGSLNFENDIYEYLCNRGHIAYVTHLCHFFTDGEEKFISLGSFQWINTRALANYLSLHNKRIPCLYNRTYAEEFLFSCLPFSFEKIASYELSYTDSKYNFGAHIEYIDDVIVNSYSDGDGHAYKDFKKFYSEIINEILHKNAK